MNMTGLRILLQGGLFFQATMTENDAKQLMITWKEGRLPPLVGDITTGWMCKTEAIVCLHLVALEQQQQGLQQKPPGQQGGYPWGTKNSG